jgi:hypothetical protein
LGLIGFIAAFIIGIKKIGFRFFMGKLLTMVLVIAMLASIAVPVFMEKRRKENAMLFEQQHENKTPPLPNSTLNSTLLSSPKLSVILFDHVIGQPPGYIPGNIDHLFFIQPHDGSDAAA